MMFSYQKWLFLYSVKHYFQNIKEELCAELRSIPELNGSWTQFLTQFQELD